MKKIILSLCLALTALSSHALPTVAQDLKDKLAAFDHIQASFVQRVTSTEGKLLNESTGMVNILRPGKFHWQVKTPEEELIVSDGKTIWYYSPFIEQVTLINFDDAITGTAFILLAGASTEQWQNYIVTKKDGKYTVTNPEQVQSTTFVFEFNSKGHVANFVVIEEQGQRSEFILMHETGSKPAQKTIYDFKIPAGVEVDDQR